MRALRLEALADSDAAIAFLDSLEDLSARPDEFWQQRTELAAQSDIAAQFVAVVDGIWVGSLSVLVRASGQTDHLGRFVDDRRADVVGVYVDPAHRGTGAIDRLLTAAADWVAGFGLRRITLDVHRENIRAQRAYLRCGFTPTGETRSSSIGPEIVMARPCPQ